MQTTRERLRRQRDAAAAAAAAAAWSAIALGDVVPADAAPAAAVVSAFVAAQLAGMVRHASLMMFIIKSMSTKTAADIVTMTQIGR